MRKIRDQIILFLKDRPRQSFKTKELVQHLGISRQGEQYQTFKHILLTLQDEDIIERLNGGKWQYKVLTNIVQGSLRMTTRGFGIVEVDTDIPREIFIHRDNTHTALDGDKVEVSVFAHRSGRREEGEVIKVFPRDNRTVVGVVKKTDKFIYVEPDRHSIGHDIYISKKHLAGARDGDCVVVQLDKWEDEFVSPQGRIIEILGRSGHPQVELSVLRKKFNLPPVFPIEVIDEAKRLPDFISESEVRNRLDLRDEICFTIDPEDAKDYDDAVSIRLDGEGNYQLGVHIADVSFYVAKDSALDREAFRRSTSVYLVGEVIPMLPERISNQLCSLQEDSDRLTYSVLITISSRGVVKNHTIVKSIIRSKRRFTYDEVEEIFRQKSGDFTDELQLMNKLAMLLMKKRFKEGSIDFDLPEIKFVLDESGRPIEIKAKPRLQSMRMIEEFMLLANKTIATHINKLSTSLSQIPFLYRVHDFPNQEKIGELVAFIKHCGFSFPLDPNSPKSFQEMLFALKGKSEEAVINSITLRAMAKAMYSEKNIGHFGLAFRYYTHFTSPIRRYPDLIVHRILSSLDKGKKNVEYSFSTLKEIAQQTSHCERNAIEAERESVRLKQVEFMQQHLGDEFDAIIDGVTHFGFFVELIPTLVDGMVHIRSMEDDYYIYDDRQKALIGRTKRKKYRIGDLVRVKLIKVDRLENRLDFILIK